MRGGTPSQAGPPAQGPHSQVARSRPSWGRNRSATGFMQLWSNDSVFSTQAFMCLSCQSAEAMQRPREGTALPVVGPEQGWETVKAGGGEVWPPAHSLQGAD